MTRPQLWECPGSGQSVSCVGPESLPSGKSRGQIAAPTACAFSSRPASQWHQRGGLQDAPARPHGIHLPLGDPGTWQRRHPHVPLLCSDTYSPGFWRQHCMPPPACSSLGAAQPSRHTPLGAGPSATPWMGPSTTDPEHAPSAAQAMAGLPSIALAPHSPSFPRVPQQLLLFSVGTCSPPPSRTLN